MVFCLEKLFCSNIAYCNNCLFKFIIIIFFLQLCSALARVMKVEFVMYTAMTVDNLKSLNCNAVVHWCPMNVNSKLKSVNYASINYKKIVWSNYYVRLMLHFKLLCV